MTALTGTGALLRLALRLDRVRLPVWVLIIGTLPAVTAAQYQELYPTKESLDQVSGVISNPSLVAINGPLFAGGSIGALTAWKVLVTEVILVGLMAILTVIRHSRVEEETGRLELLRAGVLGRHAPLTAALLAAGSAGVAAGTIAALGLIGARQPAAGSLALGAAVAFTGLLFAAVAGVAAQLTESARSATAIGTAVLGGAYLLRAVGDAGPTWVSWLSPIGWALRLRPYAGERWWTLGLVTVLALACVAVAFVLAGRRDLGAGLLPQRPGPARAEPALRSPFALAWRLHRGLLIGWVIGMAVWGGVLGGSAKGIGDATLDNERITDLLSRLGGAGALVDAYLGAVLGITGLVVAAYTVQATLRLRGEETAGRLEPLLATRTRRVRWALSHLAFAVFGTALLLAVAGAGAGLAYGAQVGDVGGQTAALLGAALVQAPAAWVLAGIGAALFGLAPRLAGGITWAALVLCLLVLEIGEILGLSQWIIDVSPFAHVPKLPGADFTVAPLLWLTVAAAALAAAGLAAFRRRDVG
ncbi:ABC transporter permease [Luedemannella helvata]|uniref:Exporter of polyketide antibiotics n=1 Tax=Luedemannella helvata TaxID=349315 RepID=A0ABN2JXZ9_9ACTN